MNLILFNSDECAIPLLRSDPRAEHILNVLKMEQGQKFDVGLINGPRGKAWWKKINDRELTLAFEWESAIPQLLPIDLWVSFCRPQTCRRILQECTSMGVQSIRFFDTGKCEPSYRKSKLWSTREAERLLRRGAEQAFCTRIPNLKLGITLLETLEKLTPKGARLALDNYESTEQLGRQATLSTPVTLAVGGERGWDNKERDALRASGFTLVDIGSRVLRTETACIAGISIIRSILAA